MAIPFFFDSRPATPLAQVLAALGAITLDDTTTYVTLDDGSTYLIQG